MLPLFLILSHFRLYTNTHFEPRSAAAVRAYFVRRLPHSFLVSKLIGFGIESLLLPRTIPEGRMKNDLDWGIAGRSEDRVRKDRRCYAGIEAFMALMIFQ